MHSCIKISTIICIGGMKGEYRFNSILGLNVYQNLMKKYLIDTEFIRATKERVHFLEISLLDPKNSNIIDFHLDAQLNNWEHRYFTRALNGHYGPRTQNVFEAVNVLHSGKFDKEYVSVFCNKQDYDYTYLEVEHEQKIVPMIEDSILYAWDISNDKELFNKIKTRNVILEDVQVIWRKRFGGNQLSLVDAYKHVLYNMGKRDNRNLIEYAHYACCDVMLLDIVMTFIDEYEHDLVPIPIEKKEVAKKIAANNLNVANWKNQINQISDEMITTECEESLGNLSKKLVRVKRKIAAANKRNENFASMTIYEKPWW